MNTILDGKNGASAGAYLDYCSVGPEDELSRITEVSKFFDRLLGAGKRVKFSKCNFGVQEVTSLEDKVKHNYMLPPSHPPYYYCIPMY